MRRLPGLAVLAVVLVLQPACRRERTVAAPDPSVAVRQAAAETGSVLIPLQGLQKE